ncbi:MAG TPA: hypothetical protein VF424_11370 [Vicinamibacterales bacterium]
MVPLGEGSHQPSAGLLANDRGKHGGLAAVNRSNLARAVNEIVLDNGKYYVLGYIPKPPPKDGKFRPLTVSVKRPNLTVRARLGYVPRMGSVESGNMANLSAALSVGVPLVGLPMQAIALLIVQTNGITRTLLIVELKYPIRPVEGIRDTFQFGTLAIDGAGSARGGTARELTFSVAGDEAAEPALAINETLDLSPGAFTVRVGVMSRALGVGGTVHVPVSVPNVSKDEFTMGAVAVGGSGTKVRVMRRETLEGLVPFQPTTRRVFGRSETLEVFAPLLWRSGAERIEAEFSLRSQGVVHASVVQRVPRLSDIAAGRAVHASLPLASVPPGLHELHVKASLPNGVTRERAVTIRIESPR